MLKNQKFITMRTFAKLTFFAFLFFATTATTLSAQQTEYGKASYYSDSFQGSTTASGAIYDKSKMTGAHKTLPFGTQVRVTRLDNKKSVVVTINDRGPFIKGRIVEVSSAAAKKIGLTIDGVTEVTLDILKKGGKTLAKVTPPVITKGPEEYDAIVRKPNVKKAVEEKVKTSKARANNTKAKAAVAAKAKPASSAKVAANAKSKAVLTAKGKTEPKKEVKSTMGIRTDNNYSAYDLYRITLERPVKTGFGVQVASMTDYENTMKKVAELEDKWFKNILLSIEKGADGKPVYKIILGHYETREQANSYKKDLKKNKKLNGFVVDLEGLK